MAYIKIWIHLVFAVKNCQHLLTAEIIPKVINHIKENSNSKGIFLDIIGGHSDHIHCLLSLGSEQCISKVANLIKGESSHWINSEKLTKLKFEWADKYFATSISESQLDTIRQYIHNQKEHHRKKSFNEEYDEFMAKYGFKHLG
ncbi:MAG: transposase [Flavobacterium sp.]|nr:transposase [Flavobacterium sp.]